MCPRSRSSDATSSTGVSSDAEGDVPFDLAGSNTATAVTDNQVQNLVHLGSGATINASNAATMQADVRPAVTNSRAKTSTTGAHKGSELLLTTPADKVKM